MQMKTMIQLALALLLASTAAAQCGLSDTQIHVAPNYTSFAPPAVGASYADATFGCIVTRVSAAGMMHEYANISPINADDTLIEEVTPGGVWTIADLTGKAVVSNLPWAGGGGGRWSLTDPRLIYYHTTNALMALRINCDGTTSSSLIQSFPQYTALAFGGGEGDFHDGDHVVLLGSATGVRDLLVYQISSRQTVATLSVYGKSFGEGYLTPSNQVVINWGNRGTAHCTNGPCFYGFEVYSQTLQYERSLTRAGQHAVTFGWNGKEYLAHVDADGTICSGSHQGIVVIDINVGVSSGVCLMSNLLPWTASVHVGASKLNTGWIVVSHTDYEASGSASVPLATNWNLPTQTWNNQPTAAGYWGPGSNEIDLIHPDGTSYRRIVHHRSRPNGANYWHIPRAAITRDAQYVVFDSDFATSQSSVYIVKVN